MCVCSLYFVCICDANGMSWYFIIAFHTRPLCYHVHGIITMVLSFRFPTQRIARWWKEKNFEGKKKKQKHGNSLEERPRRKAETINRSPISFSQENTCTQSMAIMTIETKTNTIRLGADVCTTFDERVPISLFLVLFFFAAWVRQFAVTRAALISKRQFFISRKAS